MVNDINTSASNLNEDLEKKGNWAFQWNMNFNPDPNKQAQEIIFSRKKTASLHPVVYFDNKPVKSSQIHKHLGMILDSNLNYEHHIKSILNKVNKTIGRLRKFQLILPRYSLITIYKTFIRPHLDYGDAIYDRAFNESFHQRLESIQYNAAIAITGTIRGTSSEKLLQELGLETLKSRRWFRKLYLFYNILHSKSPSYLINLIPENNNPHASRSALNNQIPFVNAKTNFLKNSFFPAVVTEFAKLRASRAYVPYVRTCVRAYVPSCLKLLRTFVPTCLRAYVPTCLSYLRALRAHVSFCINTLIYVPTCLSALIT